MGIVLQNIPKEAGITRVEYEGPKIALYTKNPRFLYENNQIISNIVNSIKKRVVVRADKSIRKPESEAKDILSDNLPDEAKVSGIIADTALGEILIEANDPQFLVIDKGFDQLSLIEKTGWMLKIKKAPHIPSPTLQTIYHTIKAGSDERERIYKQTGEKIFRSRLVSDSEVSIHTLGGFQEVGRSSILVKSSESKILLDCGIHPGAKNPRDAYPRLDWADIDLGDLDAVVLSHAHMDHQGFLPALFKYGYDGPVYCSEPTFPLMILLQSDFVKLASMEGTSQLYDMKDVREVIKHCITIPYGVVTDVSPDVKLVLNNAGHILGSSTIHLHIGEGAHNLVYTGDFKYAMTSLFDSASWNYPRVETLIMESTYGAKEDIMPNKEEVEMSLVHSINQTLKEGGKVLIPTPAVGRSQEILLILDGLMKKGLLTEAPIFTEGMISDATAIHVAYPDYLSRDLRKKIGEQGENPFISEYFTTIDHPSNRSEALQEGPAIIMATSGMLEGGPVVEYLAELAPSEKNKILFVSYQISGTLGRRILDGARQFNRPNEDGKIRIVDVHCNIERIEGFSGHSDYNQLMRYVSRLRPKLKQVIINHGEKRKVENMAYTISRLFRIPTYNPMVLEALKIY